MRTAILILVGFFLGLASNVSASACEAGHWIDAVLDDGRIIKLEDGSVWEVDSVDRIDSALWLPTEDIVVCNGRLINTDDNEKVDAVRLR